MADDVAKLTLSNSRQVPRMDHQPALQQVGWLGASGRVYGLGNGEAIRANEPGSYSALYIQIGSWLQSEDGDYYSYYIKE
jgi:hypothetical protein